MKVYETLHDMTMSDGTFYKKGTKFWLRKNVNNLGLFFSLLGSTKDDLVLDMTSLYLVFKFCGYYGEDEDEDE
jgi:hypothetical protein